MGLNDQSEFSSEKWLQIHAPGKLNQHFHEEIGKNISPFLFQRNKTLKSSSFKNFSFKNPPAIHKKIVEMKFVIYVPQSFCTIKVLKPWAIKVIDFYLDFFKQAKNSTSKKSKSK